MDAILITAIVLACPVGMGLVMWFMMKGMRGERTQQRGEPSRAEGSLAALRAEHERLAAEIERLEDRDREPEPSGSARR